ncbi:hypothetical protein BD626DRAFT_581519 [Schizophyllum amplum]|uniref:C2H2-type domain-containing protein n=1 Tax=Schizophyllum amplum TaxID=97359 RepID=A0A550CP93_9AGAR|nr:hypothetical protein BD626DRAFT_581519 [Auriculariopsis ampla]
MHYIHRPGNVLARELHSPSGGSYSNDLESRYWLNDDNLGSLGQGSSQDGGYSPRRDSFSSGYASTSTALPYGATSRSCLSYPDQYSAHREPEGSNVLPWAGSPALDSGNGVWPYPSSDAPQGWSPDQQSMYSSGVVNTSEIDGGDSFMPRRLSCSSVSSYSSSYSSPYSSTSSPSSSPVSLPMLTPPSTSHEIPVKDPKPYACPIPSCTKRCKTQHTLSVHLRAHSKPKQRPEFPCSVPGCHLHFSRRHDRLRHEVAKHNKTTDVHRCRECGHVFSFKKTLGNHRCSAGAGKTKWVGDSNDATPVV